MHLATVKRSQTIDRHSGQSQQDRTSDDLIAIVDPIALRLICIADLSTYSCRLPSECTIPVIMSSEQDCRGRSRRRKPLHPLNSMQGSLNQSEVCSLPQPLTA
jgi:hypothetical protein